MKRPFIIAEIGWNHMGDMDLAKEMIESAAKGGATHAKFQTWSVSRLKAGEWDNDGRREIYEQAQLSIKNHVELMEHCRNKGIRFLSSVFSIPDAKLLFELGCSEVKIPSFEARNHELISFCNEHFDRIFMSTGTCTMDEIADSVELIDKELYLMHCVSAYPVQIANAFLNKMFLLQISFDHKDNVHVGYSDHCYGVDTSIIALARGAEVIEKHFTTNNMLPGRDNKFAIKEDDLGTLSHFSMITWMVDTISINVANDQGYLDIEEVSRNEYTGRFNNNA